MHSKQKTFFKSLLILFSVYLLLALLKVTLFQFLPTQFSETYTQSNLREMLASEQFLASVMILIVAPIFEELMFRTLLKPTHVEFVLFLISWPAFYVAYYVIPADVNWGLRLGFIGVFVTCFTYVGAQLINPYKLRHLRAWLYKHYKWIWIVSSVSFGLIHINNYVDAFIINLPLFLNIAPRIIGGFMFGHVKIKNKHLGWSMAMHSANNAVPLVFLLLFR